MKTIPISELKVGDKLHSEIPTWAAKYGYYTNQVVASIRTTKGGRFVIKYDRTYVDPNGVEQQRQFGANYSNGALSGNKTITIL